MTVRHRRRRRDVPQFAPERSACLIYWTPAGLWRKVELRVNTRTGRHRVRAIEIAIPR